MTYPIQSWPSFRAAQIGEAAAASHHHEGSRLIYGPLASILLDQEFPVEYELD